MVKYVKYSSIRLLKKERKKSTTKEKCYLGGLIPHCIPKACTSAWCRVGIQQIFVESYKLSKEKD